MKEDKVVPDLKTVVPYVKRKVLQVSSNFFFTSDLVIQYFLSNAYISLINQLSSTDLVESNMANIGRKFKLVGYCKLLSFLWLSFKW